MKKIFIILFGVILFAAELKITSQKFIYNSQKLYSEFIGDVNATKGKDNILADKMFVYFNKQKKPTKFIAIGHVKFLFAFDNNSTYKGHCDRLEYYIKSGDIILIGNAFIKKLETNESISGSYIKMNRFTKDITVKGSKKPVNIIIKVNE
ncbi:lipopolysaccharide transport periplasmic protein LptA [Caminibacter sp.]